MRVLWVCNVMLPSASALFNRRAAPYGGWLTGALNGLCSVKSEIKLGICFPLDGAGEVQKRESEGIAYYGFPGGGRVTDKSGAKPHLREIIDDFKPDILHVHGTEYAHSLAAAEAFSAPEKTLVSIQGLCFEYAKHYFAGLPLSVVHGFNPRDMLKRENLSLQRKQFVLRGENEIKLLKQVRHVSGRTDWDRACALSVNPDLNYHFCNETLRETFYTKRWEIEKCEKHTIFASSCSYPIKGFHRLLEAMPQVLRSFPDARVFVPGRSPLELPTYKLPAYPKYLRRLILKHGLAEKVIFCGTLDEEGMAERYLKSNVFLLPSAIENSPNSLGEAMLLGVPCVAADVGGVNNILVHGREGFVYQHDSVTMLAHYICEIFENEALARRFSENASRHARLTHDRAKNASRLIEIYEAILEHARHERRLVF
jgi:glycosyltransferase involved in cell wall biosynthesis